MAIIPLRADNAYVASGKQSSQGSPVAPTVFPRWMDGTTIQIDLTAEDVWEGDSSRRLSQFIKNKQEVKFKITHTPRPVLLGFIEQAAQGSGSDSVTAASVATTTSGSSNTAGATSLTLTANTGLTGTGTAYLMLEPGTANEEVVAVTTPGTGTGPYVYTVTTPSTGLKFTHAASSTVRSSTSHALTDQSDGNYFTWEFSLGGTSGLILRVTDCKLDQVKVSGKAGSLLMYEEDWVGITSVVRTTASTVTLEAHNPFLYTQGVWTLNGATTGDALAVESFDITRKNNLDTTIQTEQLIYAALIFGNLNVDVAANVVFQNSALIGQTYFGTAAGSTPGAGATDAQAIIPGSLTLVFTQADGFHSVTYTLTTLQYSKIGFPTPKKDGKHFVQALSASSVSNQGVNSYLLQTTVTNSQTTSY
ncbi:MAG TPA: hypothetical protein VFA10_17760 [Ktedonobacteraceae bacterium]|nr:hypothetical protein [Ktedonobacteraceae bacterium]